MRNGGIGMPTEGFFGPFAPQETRVIAGALAKWTVKPSLRNNKRQHRFAVTHWGVTGTW